MNIRAVHFVLQNAFNQGLREIVVCPGSRNAPFVEYLSQNSQFKVHYFFDERSAGFFALGRARALRKPVAIVTTSGTAVANLLPACIEAFYSQVPLIFLTADRPKSLRNTGAPQTIDQSQILKNFCEVTFDLEAREISEIGKQQWNRETPLHLNICFDEPLLDDDIHLVKNLAYSTLATGIECFEKLERNEKAFEFSIRELIEALSSKEIPLIIVGGLEEEEQIVAKEVLLNLGWPVYLEGPSGLRGDSDLAFLTLIGGEKSCADFVVQNATRFVLRLGGVPTIRLWRELDFRKICHLSWGTHKFSGSEKGKLVSKPLSELLNLLDGLDFEPDRRNFSLENDRAIAADLEEIILKFPKSEPALVRAISAFAEKATSFYIGNSLPIREWDLAALRSKPLEIRANRGANGIDGQFATAIGQGFDDDEINIILGDLTMLYDLNSLFLSSRLRGDQKMNLFVINNSGGQIFSRLYKNPDYLNSHSLDFKGAAAMFQINHQEVRSFHGLKKESARKTMYEVVPDQSQTTAFWNEWNQANQDQPKK